MKPSTAQFNLVNGTEISEDEYYSLGTEHDFQYLDGRLVKEPSATYGHEDLFGFLLCLLKGYLEERGGGVVLGSRFAMRLDPRWSPEPDLVVVREENRHRVTGRCLEGPADLVVEIASPSDPRFEAREKLPRYRESGIPEIWLIQPGRKTLQIERRGPDGYSTRTVRAGRVEAAVLPGFWLDADWLWQEKRPTVVACLREILASG